MKMKKYLAPSMKDGLELMRKELGDDAIILSTRTVKSSEGDIVEIVATNEEPSAYSLPERLESQGGVPEKEETAPTRKRNSSPKRNELKKRELQQVTQSTDVGDTVNLVQLRREIAEMRSTLDGLRDAIRYRHSATLGKLYNDLYKKLRNAELSEDESLRYIGLLAARGPFPSIEEAFTTNLTHACNRTFTCYTTSGTEITLYYCLICRNYGLRKNHYYCKISGCM